MSTPNAQDFGFCEKWAPRFLASVRYVDCGTYGYTEFADQRQIIAPATIVRGPTYERFAADEPLMRALYDDVVNLLATNGQAVEGAMKLLGHISRMGLDPAPCRVARALEKALSARFYGEDFGIQALGSVGQPWGEEE